MRRRRAAAPMQRLVTRFEPASTCAGGLVAHFATMRRPFSMALAAALLALPAGLAASVLSTAAEVELPRTVELPPLKPDDFAGPDKDDNKDAQAAGEEPGPLPMPSEEAACRIELAGLGAEFEERDRLEDEGGCLVEHPIALTRLSTGIDIEPEAVLNCKTALTAARFVEDVVSPEAETVFGSPLATVNHASAYVCRPRHGQTRMSEHAFGNALDFSAFLLEDGTRLDVRAYGVGETPERDFMRDIRGEACGPFKTVLGPGTDADHATHFHFDMAERRSGSAYCR